MDPLSQAALGAAVAHGCFHRTLGRRALVWGALAGAAPDLDILLGIGADDFDRLLTHRGITHSLVFAPVVGPIWGWLMQRREQLRGAPPDRRRLGAWIGAITLALWSHPLLDTFTPYGTQLILPFANTRFAINAMPIIDPVYTLMLFFGIALAWRWAGHWRAAAASLTGLFVSTAYIGWGWQLNTAAADYAREDLAAQGIRDTTVHAYPTVLQIHYRRVVAQSATADYAGFVSMWEPCPIEWGSAPRQHDPLFDSLAATREGRIFAWFAMGMAAPYLDTTAGGTRVRLVDQRYGISNDPSQSIFAIDAIFDTAGNLLTAGMTPFPIDARGETLAGLLDRAYGACRG